MRSLVLVCTLLLLVTAPPALALPPGSADARAALALCERADTVPIEAERVDLLTRALRLAEGAVAADDGDALAHLALCCALGRRARLGGLRLGLPADVVRAVGALDRALALAPADPDVLTAKGALLIELPRLLGGDAARGEEWLRRALAVDPGHDVARGYLAGERGR